MYVLARVPHICVPNSRNYPIKRTVIIIILYTNLNTTRAHVCSNDNSVLCITVRIFVCNNNETHDGSCVSVLHTSIFK